MVRISWVASTKMSPRADVTLVGGRSMTHARTLVLSEICRISAFRDKLQPEQNQTHRFIQTGPGSTKAGAFLTSGHLAKNRKLNSGGSAELALAGTKMPRPLLG